VLLQVVPQWTRDAVRPVSRLDLTPVYLPDCGFLTGQRNQLLCILDQHEPVDRQTRRWKRDEGLFLRVFLGLRDGGLDDHNWVLEDKSCLRCVRFQKYPSLVSTQVRPLKEKAGVTQRQEYVALRLCWSIEIKNTDFDQHCQQI
jgi:hypothetical protein